MHLFYVFCIVNILSSVACGNELRHRFSVDISEGKHGGEAWLVAVGNEGGARIVLVAQGNDLARRFSYETEAAPTESSIIVVEISRRSFTLCLISRDRIGKWTVVGRYNPSELMMKELKRLRLLSKNESITETAFSTYSWTDDAHFKIDCSGTIDGSPGGTADCAITLDLKKPRSPSVQIGR